MQSSNASSGKENQVASGKNGPGQDDQPHKSALATWGPRIAALLLFAAVAGVLYYFFGDKLSLEAIEKYEAEILNFQNDYPLMVIAIAFTVYVVEMCIRDRCNTAQRGRTSP